MKTITLEAPLPKGVKSHYASFAELSDEVFRFELLKDKEAAKKRNNWVRV